MAFAGIMAPTLKPASYLRQKGCLGEILQATGHQGRPASLVARPQATSMLAMEVLVKEHEMAPVRVRGKMSILTMARSAAMRIWEKEPR